MRRLPLSCNREAGGQCACITTQMEPLATETRDDSLKTPYEPPAVWTWTSSVSRFPPVSGGRRDRELPRGEHSLQLYTSGHGVCSRVTILLEEIHDIYGLEYDGWSMSLPDDDQYGKEFVANNPNSKVPLLIDRGVQPPVRVFESSHIMLYIGEKFGQYFMPHQPHRRVECVNWVFWSHEAAAVFANFGHFFTEAPVAIREAVDLYTSQTKRLLAVLDQRLEQAPFVVVDYSLADMAIFPLVRDLDTYYGAARFLDLDNYVHLANWRDRMFQRAAVKRGLRVAGFGLDAIRHRHQKADFILR